ncbi:hypothetical protein BDV18DRAFT_159996 [Aspergillus unguis]
MRRIINKIKHLTRRAKYKEKGVDLPESPFEKLPAELWLLILEKLVGADPVLDPYSYLHGSVPASFCLVNKRFNNFFTPILYYRFDFDGNPQHFKSLLLFLRTLIKRPDLASYVQESTMTAHQFAQPYPLTSTYDEIIQSRKHLYTTLRTLSHKTKPYIKKAMANVHFDFIMRLITRLALSMRFARIRDLTPQKHDLYKDRIRGGLCFQAPLVALILAHCPNLHRLTCDVLPQNMFMAWIVRRAGGELLKSAQCVGFERTGEIPVTERTPRPGMPFQRLKVLIVEPAVLWNWIGDVRECASPLDVLTVSKDYPWHRLPSLEELVMLGVTNTREVNGRVEEYGNCLERLTVTNIGRGLDRFVPVLKGAPHLRQLSLQLKSSVPSSGKRQGMKLHKELWSTLHMLKDQLEYLDLRQEQFNFLPDDATFAGDAHRVFCPYLSGFTQLRQLNITPLLLVGHQCKHRAPKKMRSHLPPNVESLGIYCEDTDWLSEHVLQLEDELEGIVLSGSERSLRCITVDNAETLPIGKMQAAAKSKFIPLYTEGGEYLCYGGEETPYYDVYRLAYDEYSAGQAIQKMSGRKAAEVIPRGLQVHGYNGKMGIYKRSAAEVERPLKRAKMT